MNETNRHLGPVLAGAVAAAIVPTGTALASSTAPLALPGQIVAAPEDAPARALTLANPSSCDCQHCPDCNEQPLVLVTTMFTVVALIGIIAWTAAFWKLLALLKTHLPPTPPGEPIHTATAAPARREPEAGKTTVQGTGDATGELPDDATESPDQASPGFSRPSLQEASADSTAAVLVPAPGPATAAADQPCPTTPGPTAPEEQPGATAVTRDFCRFLPDFLARPDFQKVLASLCQNEPSASRDRELLAGHLAVLNAAVQASDRRPYHDAMLETALRGIGTCLATLSREQQPPDDATGCDLLTWEKQLQALLSTTTEYGLRTPMTGDKVDNDWMSAPPHVITVSDVDCWAIYKRNDIICKALVR